MNNQKKAERACRRFIKARQRQNYITSIQGADRRMLVAKGDIGLTVTSIDETDSAIPLIWAEVTAVLHYVGISVGADATDAEALAKQAADLAVLRGREHVTVEDLEDAEVPAVLSEEDASTLATYLEHSLNILGDGLAFRVHAESIDAVVFAPVLYATPDSPPFDEGNVLPLAQAKFEAMVAA